MSFFNILMICAMLAVVASLCLGLFAMVRKGEAARAQSQKFMQLRLVLQAAALGFFLLAMLNRSNG